MNKQDLKEMLDFAGVDITKGKAKALIESTASNSDQVKCPDCLGKGMKKYPHQGEDEWDTCRTCDGKKTISKKAVETYDD